MPILRGERRWMSAGRNRRGPAWRGFSLFELMVVVILFGVLATILLNRLAYYEELAEKAKTEYTISAVRNALRLRVAELMIGGRLQENVHLPGQNPMDWLDVKPDNYIGELARPDNSRLQPGTWYFDSADRTLVYVVRHGASFVSESHRKHISLKVTMMRGGETPAEEQMTAVPTDAVELRLLTPYRWGDMRRMF